MATYKDIEDGEMNMNEDGEMNMNLSTYKDVEGGEMNVNLAVDSQVMQIDLMEEPAEGYETHGSTKEASLVGSSKYGDDHIE